MLPAYELDSVSSSRLPLSRVTVGAMADLGYAVNFECADDGVRVLSTCSVSSRKRQKLQTIRFRYLMRWTACRKAVRRGKRRHAAFGSKARKTCRRSYRRLRRKVKRVITAQSTFRFYPAKEEM